jgi:hypothetical protein
MGKEASTELLNGLRLEVGPNERVHGKRWLEPDYLKTPHDRAFSKEVAFDILTQGTFLLAWSPPAFLCSARILFINMDDSLLNKFRNNVCGSLLCDNVSQGQTCRTRRAVRPLPPSTAA